MQKFFYTNIPDEGRLKAFRKALKEWGKFNFRPFPWRLTRDPYRILIAEILLHRTKASQVVPVYENLIKRYPDIETLSRTSKKELFELLKSLGLFWRVDALYEMANILGKDFSGQIPIDKNLLLSLPGVSDYIAGAVRCFAWNLPEPLLDTNTVRVTARVFGLKAHDSFRRNRNFIHLFKLLMDQNEPRDFMFALLDLAEKICSARSQPRCDQCPIVTWCSFKNNESNK